MPLIIREGDGQTVSCRHSRVGVHATEWYREESVIRPSMPQGPDGCSCETSPFVEGQDDPRTLTFMNFDGRSAGEYSCRIPDPFNDPIQNICRFRVLAAGK